MDISEKISSCLINQENIPCEICELQTSFVNNFFDTLDSIRRQFVLTFQNYDKTNYINEFLSDEDNKEFLNSEYIDYNLFFKIFEEELYKYFNNILGFDLLSKSIAFSECKPEITSFVILYNSYKSIVLNQSFIIEIIYKLFSSLSTKQIENIEKLLNKKIQKTTPKSVLKKFKIKSNNYILDIKNVTSNKNELSTIILNTNLFGKHLQNTIYENETTQINYLFECFIRLSSKYEIDNLFKYLLKNDVNFDILINKVEVYAFEQKFI